MLCLILIFFLLDPKGSKNEATHKKGTFLFLFFPFFLFFSSSFLPWPRFCVRHFPNVEKTSWFKCVEIAMYCCRLCQSKWSKFYCVEITEEHLVTGAIKQKKYLSTSAIFQAHSLCWHRHFSPIMPCIIVSLMAKHVGKNAQNDNSSKTADITLFVPGLFFHKTVSSFKAFSEKVMFFVSLTKANVDTQLLLTSWCVCCTLGSSCT